MHLRDTNADRAEAATVQPASQRSKDAHHRTGKNPERQKNDAAPQWLRAHLPRMNEIAEPLRVIGKEAEEALIRLDGDDFAPGLAEKTAVPVRRVAAVINVRLLMQQTASAEAEKSLLVPSGPAAKACAG